VKEFDVIALKDAVALAVEKAVPKREYEVVMLQEAHGRVLAEDIIACKNLPSFNNSAMDGFAYRHTEGGKRLRIAGSIFAGDIPEPVLQNDECYKIMTGAQLPSDVDTVVPIEMCSDITESEVTIPESIVKGANFRKKGEEVKAGEIVLLKGTILYAAQIALLAAQGIVAVKVVSKPKIAVVSTGNEIKEPWMCASEDEIYNANAFGIGTLLGEFGFEYTYTGAIPDDLEATISFISKLKSYDVVLTTGGISQGDADFLYEAFIRNGLKPFFHGVNLKPGRAVMMGEMENTFVMAMPGNPLTTMLTVHALSIPVLYTVSGADRCYHNVVYARFSQDLKLRGGRTNMVIGTLENGSFTPTRNNKIGSGMLTPLCESNAVAFFGESVEYIEKGCMVKVICFADENRADEDHTVNEIVS